MASAILDRVEAALRRAGSERGKAAGTWRCPVPSHGKGRGDKNPSLAVHEKDGRVLLHCRAECPLDDVLEAIGLGREDLRDGEPKRGRKANGRAAGAAAQRVADYIYTDRSGEPLARKVRFHPKTFRWEVPDESGGWRLAGKGEGNPGVLYRLVELVESDGTVYLHEGEKAAESFAERGLPATCPPTPAWTQALAEPLRGRDVVIFADRDKTGPERARKAFEALRCVARSVRVVQAAVEKEGADGFDHLEAGHAPEDAIPLDLAAKVDPENPTLQSVSFSGDALLNLLRRPMLDPVEPGVPVPGHLMLMVAPAMTGKTSWALWSAMARAAGVAPWEGAPAPETGRVLIFSLDEAPEQVARRINGLAALHPAGPIVRYAHNLTVVGPDRDVPGELLDALRFDSTGLATVRGWLEEAAEAVSPFREIYIDAYSDVLPLGESDSSNEEATRIGGELERIAVRYGTAVTLLHHTGKARPEGDGEPDLRLLSRGASALVAKARVVAALEAVPGFPHLRRIRTLTNLSRAPRPLTLRVCSPEADCEEIVRFVPHDALGAYKPEDFLGAEPITTNALAWALADREPERGKRPPGEASRLAAELRERWRKAGQVVVEDGPNRSKLIRLRRDDAGCA